MEIYKPAELLQYLATNQAFLQLVGEQPAYLCGLAEGIRWDCICAHKEGTFSLAFEKKQPLKLTASELLSYLAEQRECEQNIAKIVRTYNLITNSRKASYSRLWTSDAYHIVIG